MSGIDSPNFEGLDRWAFDARRDEACDGVLGEREAGNRDERLRMSLRRLPQPFRLAPREEQRLHQCWSSGFRSRSSGSGADACLGRPIPS